MIIPKLALRNVLGAGLRTWLKVSVLSIAFVVIIFGQGLMKGLVEEATRSTIDFSYGGGQYWHNKYDPYDPFTLEDAHGKLNNAIKNMIKKEEATPILVVQGSIYPEGRIRPVSIKGIEPSQKIIAIPTSSLSKDDEDLPVLIGTRMANSTGLKLGDYVTVQWRDAQGTFDAIDARIVHIMKTTVGAIDNGQIWVPLEKLQKMSNMNDEATIIVTHKNMKNPKVIQGWRFKDLDFLLSDVYEMNRNKTVGNMILYSILLFLAMIAIFDTQILSIFKRRKEVGTLMALGVTRGKLILLFTLEGAIHGIFAAIFAAIYGLPLFYFLAKNGWAMPELMEEAGFIAIGDKLFPVFTVNLILGTMVIVLIITTIVSYIPTRRIANLKPTDALRGKLSC